VLYLHQLNEIDIHKDRNNYVERVLKSQRNKNKNKKTQKDNQNNKKMT